jgi:hypothetical protein
MAEMSPARKRAALAFVAIGIALIVQRTIASGGEDAVVVPAERARPVAGADVPAPARRAGNAVPSLRLDRLDARAAPPAASAAAAPLFAVQSWQPPPAPPPPPPPPAEPEVPAFPYPYLGGLTDDRGRWAFFKRGERVLALRAGETVDGAFRVDHLDETSMTVTYLPLNQSADLPLGGAR